MVHLRVDVRRGRTHRCKRQGPCKRRQHNRKDPPPKISHGSPFRGRVPPQPDHFSDEEPELSPNRPRLRGPSGHLSGAWPASDRPDRALVVVAMTSKAGVRQRRRQVGISGLDVHHDGRAAEVVGLTGRDRHGLLRVGDFRQKEDGPRRRVHGWCWNRDRLGPGQRDLDAGVATARAWQFLQPPRGRDCQSHLQGEGSSGLLVGRTHEPHVVALTVAAKSDPEVAAVTRPALLVDEEVVDQPSVRSREATSTESSVR